MPVSKTLFASAALAAFLTAATAMADAAAPVEKCYGIAKAGKNDCASKIGGNACAGQTSKDGQGFITLPKGQCEKIVGGKVME
jgi:uncharacterized membrane protein